MTGDIAALHSLRQAAAQGRIKGLLKRVSELLDCQAVAQIKHDLYAWPALAQYDEAHVQARHWQPRPPAGQVTWVEHFYVPAHDEYILRCQIVYDSFPLGHISVSRPGCDFDETAALLLDYSAALCAGFNHQYIKSQRIRELLRAAFEKGALQESELSLLAERGYALALRERRLAQPLKPAEQEENDFLGYLIHNAFAPQTVHAFLENSDLLLFTDTPRIEAFVDQLRDLLAANGRRYVIGVSERYARERLDVAFAEARHAASIGELLDSKGEIFFFHKLGIYRLFNYPDNGWTINQMLDEMTEKLDTLEPEKKHLLTETLTCLVRNNYNYSKTAEEMFAHPNTIRYRISILEELWGRDLSRDEDRLLFSLIGKLLPLWKRYTKYSPPAF